MRFFLPGTLLALWLLAWGEVTLGNVLSGIVLIFVLLVVFPSALPGRTRVHVRPIPMLRLVGYVSAQLIVSTVLVGREIVSRESRVRTGVIGYRVKQPSDLTLTLMSNIIALSPGTMPVDVTSEPSMLYVHFLLLSDVEDARRRIGRLESLVVAAVETRPPSADVIVEEEGQ